MNSRQNSFTVLAEIRIEFRKLNANIFGLITDNFVERKVMGEELAEWSG